MYWFRGAASKMTPVSSANHVTERGPKNPKNSPNISLEIAGTYRELRVRLCKTEKMSQ